MTQRLVIFLQSIVLIIFGSVFIWFYVHGRLEKYLTSAGSFQIQALIAGLVLCMIGIFLVITSGNKAGCAHDHDHDQQQPQTTRPGGVLYKSTAADA